MSVFPLKKQPKKFIQKIGLKKGALHRALGIPEGQKIPKGALMEAAKKPGRLGKMARFAITLGKF